MQRNQDDAGMGSWTSVSRAAEGRKEEAKEKTVYNKQAMGVFWKCDPSNWGKSHPELLKKEGAKKKQRPQHKPTR